MLTTKQKEVLINLTPEPLFVTDHTVELLTKELQLKDRGTKELQKLRDSVVMFYSDFEDSYGRMGLDYVTRMSMVVAVIDYYIFS